MLALYVLANAVLFLGTFGLVLWVLLTVFGDERHG